MQGFAEPPTLVWIDSGRGSARELSKPSTRGNPPALRPEIRSGVAIVDDAQRLLLSLALSFRQGACMSETDFYRDEAKQRTAAAVGRVESLTSAEVVVAVRTASRSVPK